MIERCNVFMAISIYKSDSVGLDSILAFLGKRLNCSKQLTSLAYFVSPRNQDCNFSNSSSLVSLTYLV